MYTDQEMFDFVVAKMVEQNKQSKSESNDNECAYRGAGNLKCAAGHLIPVDKYSPTMEGWSISGNAKILDLFKSLVKNLSLLGELQYIHDNYVPEEYPDISFARYYKNEAKRLVARYNLAWNFID